MYNIKAVSSGFLPLIIVLTETKCEDVSRITGLRRLGYDGVSSVASVGRSGGIFSVWRKDLINVTEVMKGRQMIHLHCSVKGFVPFFLSTIYAIPIPSYKQALWQDMKALSVSISEPWVIVGDFNDILGPSERIGGSVLNDNRVKLFHDRLQDCRLSNLGFSGPRFT